MKEKDIDKLYDSIVQPSRDERSMELFGKKESELGYNDIVMLEKYINDYNKPPIWKQIIWDNCFTNYEVSNMGQIRFIKNGNILKPSANEFGYLRVRISTRPCEWHTFKVHRLVAMAFIPNPEKKREVNHISCVKTCNWVGNLEWATSHENKIHARKHGLYHDRRGQEKFNVRYTDEQINQVCKMLEDGKSAIQISRELNIPVSCPISIKYNGRWKHISCNYKIPKPGEIPRFNKDMRYATAKYSEDQIREVCKLLSQGKMHRDIAKETGISESIVGYVYRRNLWNYLSKDYVFPDIKALRCHPRTKYRNQIIEMLNAGETDYGKILEKVGVPDTRESRKYIVGIKMSMKNNVQRLSTNTNVRETRR